MTRRLMSTSLTAGKDAVPTIVGGEGIRFHLADGRKVIDASNTAAPLGHGHPELTEAVRAVAGAPVVNEGWGWREREAAAEDLVDIAFGGEDWVGSVRFFLSASEANDAALALSQALTGRAALVTRERAYHGGTGLARDLTVQPHWTGGLSRRVGAPDAPPRSAPVHIIPRPAGARIVGGHDGPLTWSEEDRAVFGESAAVLLDYSQGGTYHTAEYQDSVAAMAKSSGCLWIADETVTGFGRVGGWFQFQHAESRPDMVTMGKCMAAGYAPAGALVLSRELTEALEGRAWQSYSTFRAHVASVAAVRAHLRVSQRESYYTRAIENDAFLARRMKQFADEHPSVARIDGRGMHWTVEFHGPSWRDWVGQEAEPLASRVASRILDHDVLVTTSGERTSLFLTPPLICTEQELNTILDAVEAGLAYADTQPAGVAGAKTRA